MAIQTTVGELLQLAINDTTPKTTGAYYRMGATCFNGGIATALGLRPAAGGGRVVSALNKIKIAAGRLPRVMRGLYPHADPEKPFIGLGNLSIDANDKRTLKKATIARKLLETLTPEELAQPVKIVEPRYR